MKTATQIENIIIKLRNDLEDVRARIDDIRTWANAGNFMQNQEFFVQQMKYLEDLQKQEWQAEYRIRAYEYVLEKPKAE
jgi:uracil DNA glycosylase